MEATWGKSLSELVQIIKAEVNTVSVSVGKSETIDVKFYYFFMYIN